MPWLPVLLLLCLFAPPAAGDSLEPRLAALLAEQPYGEDIPFVLTLTSRADPKAWPLQHGPQRRRAMLRDLRSHAAGSQKELKAFLRQRGARQLRSLWLVNGLAGRTDAATLRALADWPQVEQVRLDEGPGVPEVIPEPHAEPSWNLRAVQAPALWDLGYTGAGVVVATMDTGADLGHPDLAARWRGGSNSWFDPYGEHPAPHDASGHGTQVLGVLVGGASGGAPIGVAPGAQWISVKMFNDAGRSRTSAIIQGFEWLLDPDGNPETADAPALINCSWGFADSPGQCDPLFRQVLQTVKAAGVAVTVSAGNSGPGEASSQSPANYLESFSVGALNSANELASFSSRGPSACDGGIFPRLTAPGAQIRTTHPTALGSYAMVSGTSFAAPHVAGIMALLMEAVPGISPSMLEQVLEDTARDLGPDGADNGFGFGLADGLAAYAQLEQWPQLRIGEQGLPPQQVLFANQPPGGTLEQIVLLSNKGGSALEFTGIVVEPAPFVLVADGCSGRSLIGGEDCAVTIGFSPAHSGRFNGGLRIASNAIATPLADIPLRATAYQPAVPLAPNDNASALGREVTFRWLTAVAGDGQILSERLLLTEAQGFHDQQSHAFIGSHLATATALLLLGGAAGGRHRWPLRLTVVASLILFAQLPACGGSNDPKPGADPERSLTVADLKPATTYYWKVVAEDEFGNLAESSTRQFTTAARPAP